MFRLVFVYFKLCIGYVDKTSYIQRITEPRPRKSLRAPAMSHPRLSRSSFTSMQLGSWKSVCHMPLNLVSTGRDYNRGMRMGYTGQVVLNAWKHARGQLDWVHSDCYTALHTLQSLHRDLWGYWWSLRRVCPAAAANVLGGRLLGCAARLDWR